MRYSISHSLNYSYNRPVFIEPQTIRLRPRSDSLQQVLVFKLDVIPVPDGISEQIDQECNNTATLWFSGKYQNFLISSKSEVEVTETNPFNFIVTDNDFLTLPIVYQQSYRQYLYPYLSHQHPSSELDKFVRPVIEESSGETIPFLVRLTSRIHNEFDRSEREIGAPMTPKETIIKRNGACRDLAFLFMAGCRTIGLATRFVSGYRWSEDLVEQHNLHAWAEVYIPGAGWRGFDPSTGLAVTNQHVAVVTAADPVDTLPVSGTFRGTGVRSRLEYNVTINLL